MEPLTLRRLSLIFLRVGNLTFGGGDPTMAALHSELVKSRGWLTPAQYGLAYALARITPGTNVLAFSAAIAWELLAWPGAILAVVAASAPSAVLAAFLTAGYESGRSNPLAMAAIAGTLAAAVGMMGTGAWQLIWPHLRAGRWVRSLVVVSASIVLSLVFSLSPIYVLGLAAVAGLLWRTPAEQ